MRNALTHGHFKVDLDIVWKATQGNLQELDNHVAALLIAVVNGPVSDHQAPTR
ncbi:HepT-like ribonuclease domain-containing protein [Ralstonia chuxiongensis]|uniref:HepT-like ribonuclease domain-containing protein n=1 Tax=Ralstonia chuxiongensis TaxID=2957504 RepID=UPI0028F5B68D|nr:HepT-like ribonuclease domain-containing protein [Ralstonia chuxiongensis]CAJ0780148.1 hypothetical protein R8510_04706 [Ralstonia chuxiongensis]